MSFQLFADACMPMSLIWDALAGESYCRLIALDSAN